MDLHWNASVAADIAFLDRAQAGETHAECVRAAIEAFLLNITPEWLTEYQAENAANVVTYDDDGFPSNMP